MIGKGTRIWWYRVILGSSKVAFKGSNQGTLRTSLGTSEPSEGGWRLNERTTRLKGVKEGILESGHLQRRGPSGTLGF